MNYKMKGINAEEIRFKVNAIKADSAKVEIKPLFKRQVKNSKFNENEKLINLTVTIESTEQNPQFFNLYISFIACFDVCDVANQADYEAFLMQATKDVYHYLRNAVINVTSAANIIPFLLPINPPYFPAN